MPTPFQDWNRRYKTGQDPAGPGNPGPPKKKYDRKVEEVATRVLNRMSGGAQQIRQDITQGAQTMGQGFTGAYRQAAQVAPGMVNQAGKVMSAAGRRVTAPLRKMDEALGRAGQITENNIQNFSSDLRQKVGGAVDTMKDNARQIPGEVSEFGRGMARDVDKLKGMVETSQPSQYQHMRINALPGTYNARGGPALGPSAPPSSIDTFTKGVESRFKQMAGQSPIGPGRGPLYPPRNNAPQGTAQAATPPAKQKPNGMPMPVRDPGQPEQNPAQRTPSDQGEPVGIPKPGAAEPTGASGTPEKKGTSRYLDAYYAGPGAQSKDIKDADLIHMIRGTKQTWGNPTIQGNLGIKEFNSALEAAHGIDHAEAMAKHGIDVKANTELAKAQLDMAKAQAGREVKVVTATDGDFNEIPYAYDPNTGQWSSPTGANNPDIQAAQVAFNDMVNMSPEEQDAAFMKMPSKQRKIILQLIEQFK